MLLKCHVICCGGGDLPDIEILSLHALYLARGIVILCKFLFGGGGGGGGGGDI